MHMKQLEPGKNHPFIRVLSDDQVREIHEASLIILDEIGIDLRDEEAVGLLISHGATVSSLGRAHFPPALVGEALRSVPRSIPLYTRRGELAMPLCVGNVYFGTGSDTIYTHDLESGERRNPTRRDIRRIATLCDALPNISFIMSMGTVWDVPTADNYVHAFIEMLRGSVKPIVFTAKDRCDVEHIWRIAVSVSGGEEQLRERPFFLHYPEPISPLLFTEESVQKLLFCAEKGIPVTYCPSPNMGSGGPVTMAGALAQANAEILAGVILAQLKNPGCPCLYGANIAVFDMQTAVISYGAPEWSLSMAALADMSRFYGLPVWGTGGATDSKIVDAQAGLEAMQSIYTAFLSRCTLNHDVGYIESGLTSSAEMIVLADEIISMVQYIVEGVSVDPNSLALDAIRRIKPGASYLTDDHTLDNWRGALFFPKLLNRERFESWEKGGRLNMSSRLNQTAREILARHQVPPLSDGAEKEINAVLEERRTF
jgi:trimethylamine--corrinoid protein Co-methyltransferase